MIRTPGIYITALTLVLLSACSTSKIVSLPEPTIVDRSAKPASGRASAKASATRIQRILILLDEADRAFKEKRLTTPENNNAWSFYSRVLMLQPHNEEAQQGLNKIVELYIRWSEQASAKGRIDSAGVYLQRATRVNPYYPGLKKRIASLSPSPSSIVNAEDGRIYLDVAAVRSRKASAKSQLRQIADQVKANNARVIIEAPSDASGRWIYQQMNQRHEDYRIRANMKIKPKPAVRLLY
ncbi:MAG: hypothetical protein OQK12_02875 [Motiliproteus sp.]|nr:hypothetical protein [Motiliproteus sp.]